jgi:hypothetical protein
LVRVAGKVHIYVRNNMFKGQIVSVCIGCVLAVSRYPGAQGDVEGYFYLLGSQ